MKRLILCALVGAVVAQIWGMISWMVLPWHNLDFRQFKDDVRVAQVIQSQQQGSGLYTIPNMDENVHKDEAALAAWNQRASEGPFAFVSVRAEGIQPGMGVPMAIGFGLNFFMALILLWLVGQSSVRAVGGRSLFIAVAGAVGAIYPHMSNWNWWHFPLTYCVVGVVDLFVTWLLAGWAMNRCADRMS